MKLACMSLPYAQYSFERALEGISRAGYRYSLPHLGIDVPEEATDKAAAHLLRLFDKHNLEPVMLIGNKQLSPNNPIEYGHQRLQFAKSLGISEVLTIGTFSYRKMPSEPYSEEEMKHLNLAFIKHFQKLARLAEQIDIVITLKPHTGNTATAVQLAETLDRIGSPFVKASYDPRNVQYYEGIEADRDIPTIASRTHSLIVKDHRGAQWSLDFPIPGTGDVNFPSLFQTLNETGFDGPLVVERIDGLPGAEDIDNRL